MGHHHGPRWSTELVERELRPIAEQLGRMPTADELRRLGRNDLHCAIRGGMHGGLYADWARRLGLERSNGNTHRAQAIEEFIAGVLTDAGYSVARQATKAPYDLLVEGAVRVDVKSAQYHEYALRSGDGRSRGRVRGHVFPLGRKNDCDLFILCGVDSENKPLWQYFIPAPAAQVSAITITPTGTKYSRYLGAIGELARLAGRQQ